MQENHIHDIDREQEEHEYHNAQPNFDLTVAKDSIIPNVQTGIETLVNGIESGEINALDVFATFKKLEKIFTDAKVKVESHAFVEADKYDKTFTFSGVSFTRKDGSESMNYQEDDLCKELSEKLKQRQELVKLATKSKEPIYDADGVQVPKVSSKFGKSSLKFYT